MNYVLAGQISFFDLEIRPAAPKKANCYECLYWESHRCRNQRACPEGMNFVKYTGSTVTQCIEATVEEFQDGYIHCPIIDCRGCEWCMEQLNSDEHVFVFDKSQNYKRFPRQDMKGA